jgi:NAD(P)-dependent dehydrogenase (short-subunit alcohol dehydrogenase family)
MIAARMSLIRGRHRQSVAGSPTASYYKNSVSLGRFASAEEVAAIVSHLTSSEARYTNGMLYSLDLGLTAGYYSGPA